MLISQLQHSTKFQNWIWNIMWNISNKEFFLEFLAVVTFHEKINYHIIEQEKNRKNPLRSINVEIVSGVKSISDKEKTSNIWENMKYYLKFIFCAVGVSLTALIYFTSIEVRHVSISLRPD